MKNLFVGNMSFQTTEGDLRALFEPFGQVARVHIAMDRETGRSRGFAFVEMPNDAEAAAAMQGLDGKDLGGRNLRSATPLKARESSWKRGPRKRRADRVAHEAAVPVATAEARAAAAAGNAAAAVGEEDFRTRTTANLRANRANLAGRE